MEGEPSARLESIKNQQESGTLANDLVYTSVQPL